MQRWLNLKIGAHFFSLGSEFESPHSSLLICPQYFCAFKEIMSRDFPPQPRTGTLWNRWFSWRYLQNLKYCTKEIFFFWIFKKNKPALEEKSLIWTLCKNCLSRCIVVDYLQKRDQRSCGLRGYFVASRLEYFSTFSGFRNWTHCCRSSIFLRSLIPKNNRF